MTIKVRILSSLLVLGLILIVVCLIDTFKVVNNMSEIKKAIEINEASNQLLVAAGDLAVERGITAASLGNPAKMQTQQRQTLDEKRAGASQALDTALAIVRKHGSGVTQKDIVELEHNIKH